MKAYFIQSDATRIPLEDSSVDLIMTSPPYIDARLYLENGDNLGVSRKCEAWVNWMMTVVGECLRVSRGPVIVNCAGVTRKRNYQPGPEGLQWEAWKRGFHSYRPVFWNRVGIPGSGGDDWFRADVEYCLCFKHPGSLPWSDNTACGHIPKWGPGGEMSHRLGSGARVNQWGKNGSRRGIGARRADGSFGDCDRPSHVEFVGGVPIDRGQTAFGPRPGKANMRADREKDQKKTYFNGNGFKKRHTNSNDRGEDVEQIYVPPVLANPGNMVRVKVGGGILGHPAAHSNEAPYPEKLVEFFIKSLCPPGGKVLDPFSGSGTTACVAERLGRIGIGCDLRMSQSLLGRKRFLNPHMKKSKPRKPVVGQHEMFTEAGAA